MEAVRIADLTPGHPMLVELRMLDAHAHREAPHEGDQHEGGDDRDPEDDPVRTKAWHQ